jgi:peptidylprolyl isomerase
MSTQTESAKRRGQAFAGAFAGVAIVVVLTVVFFVVRNGDDDKAPAAASRPAATQPAEVPPPSEAAAPAPSEAGPPSEAAQPGAAGVDTPPALSKEPQVTAGKGKLTKLVKTTLVPGTGPAVQKGQTVTANYKLVKYDTGQVMDSSWSRGEPFSTQIGVGQVIQGWDQGIVGLKVGSRTQLDVPEALAYPGQGDLRFVVDILAAK